MKKSILIDINKKDKYICWCSNDTKLIIVGGLTQDMCIKSLHNFIEVMNYHCNYGYFNGCNIEIINRILKAVEVE